MNYRLLVADDNAAVHKMIRLAFSGEDVVVETVFSGDAALEILNEFNPDVVLADVSMPGYNGYEVCEIIRHDPRFSSILVILMNGPLDYFDEDEAARVQISGYLTKPFNTSELIAMVERLLTEKAPQPSHDSFDDQADEVPGDEEPCFELEEDSDEVVIEVPTQNDDSAASVAAAPVELYTEELPDALPPDALTEEEFVVELPAEELPVALTEEEFVVELPDALPPDALTEEEFVVELPAEELPDALTEEEFVVELPAEELPDALPAEEFFIELPAEESSIELPAEESPIELPAEESPIELPAPESRKNSSGKSSVVFEEADPPSGFFHLTPHALESYLGPDRILEIFNGETFDRKAAVYWGVPEALVDRVAEKVMKKISSGSLQVIIERSE